ncbi:hypothetical protein K227x_19140 [Rubripirellula lacrimiformis]|uniref:Uncharacterized protein n=1 Tax=Rubripirellula lacrimiformis TaxID=1930273 RepID=A0A517N8R5_9BACT|nr:hypothetical protein K227x_19140 [Rubripirellula lacrimiformis]
MTTPLPLRSSCSPKLQSTPLIVLDCKLRAAALRCCGVFSVFTMEVDHRSRKPVKSGNGLALAERCFAMVSISPPSSAVNYAGRERSRFLGHCKVSAGVRFQSLQVPGDELFLRVASGRLFVVWGSGFSPVVRRANVERPLPRSYVAVQFVGSFSRRRCRVGRVNRSGTRRGIRLDGLSASYLAWKGFQEDRRSSGFLVSEHLSGLRLSGRYRCGLIGGAALPRRRDWSGVLLRGCSSRPCLSFCVYQVCLCVSKGAVVYWRSEVASRGGACRRTVGLMECTTNFLLREKLSTTLPRQARYVCVPSYHSAGDFGCVLSNLEDCCHASA